MVIFHSYVSLPEGSYWQIPLFDPADPRNQTFSGSRRRRKRCKSCFQMTNASKSPNHLWLITVDGLMTGVAESVFESVKKPP